MIFLMQIWIGCHHLLWNVWWEMNLKTTGRGWIEAEEEKLEPYLRNIWGADSKWTERHKNSWLQCWWKYHRSQLQMKNINLYRSRLKWPQLEYFRNKRQIIRWPTQSLWTVSTFATSSILNFQFSRVVVAKTTFPMTPWPSHQWSWSWLSNQWPSPWLSHPWPWH